MTKKKLGRLVVVAAASAAAAVAVLVAVAAAAARVARVMTIVGMMTAQRHVTLIKSILCWRKECEPKCRVISLSLTGSGSVHACSARLLSHNF